MLNSIVMKKLIIFLCSILDGSASQATSTTPRSSPPWLITSQPSVWGTSTIRYATTRMPPSEPTVDSSINRNNHQNNGANNSTTNRLKSVTKPKTITTTTTSTSGNETLSPNANRRNNENASVAAVTKSIYNNYTPTNSGNTIASSTFSAPPKAIG